MGELQLKTKDSKIERSRETKEEGIVMHLNKQSVNTIRKLNVNYGQNLTQLRVKLTRAVNFNVGTTL